MKRYRHSLTTLCVAVTLLLSSYVAAQAPKAAPRVLPAPAKGETRVEAILREELNKIAVPRPAVPAARLVMPEQARRTAAQQMIPRLRPLLHVEYHVLVRACDPSAEQRRQIARAGERALRQAAMQGMTTRNTLVVNPDGTRRIVQEQRGDPLKTIRDGLAAAAERHLSSEQAERYNNELKRRREFWMAVGVDAVVSRVDEELCLAAEQRTAMAKTLREHWNDAWIPTITALLNIQRYFPPIPDELIVECLDEPQSRAWKAAHATRQYVNFGLSANGDDGGLEDQALAEAREAGDQALEGDKP